MKPLPHFYQVELSGGSAGYAIQPPPDSRNATRNRG